MNLYLRKVVHPQAHDNYRVVLKRDADEFEIGSIGIQHDAAWRWGIDTVIPLRAHETQGKGNNRRDCMRQFKTAWERFAGDEANLVEFLKAKRKRRPLVTFRHMHERPGFWCRHTMAWEI